MFDLTIDLLNFCLYMVENICESPIFDAFAGLFICTFIVSVFMSLVGFNKC